MSDFIDQRDGLIQHREKLFKAFSTGIWDGEKVEGLAFLGLCLNTLEEMISWNEPITWEEYRSSVLDQERRNG